MSIHILNRIDVGLKIAKNGGGGGGIMDNIVARKKGGVAIYCK